MEASVLQADCETLTVHVYAQCLGLSPSLHSDLAELNQRPLTLSRQFTASSTSLAFESDQHVTSMNS